MKFKQGLERGKMMGKDETAKEDENTEKSSNVWVNISLLIAALIIIVLFIFLLSTHLGSPNGRDDISLFGYTKSDLGTLGDFLGGALNPILSFLTICLLVWSIDIQIRELRETREELEKSRDINFESSKTQLLSSLYSRQAIMYPAYKGKLANLMMEISKFYELPKNESSDCSSVLFSYLCNKNIPVEKRKEISIQIQNIEAFVKIVRCIEQMTLLCEDLIEVHTSLPMCQPWFDAVFNNSKRLLLIKDFLPSNLVDDLNNVLSRKVEMLDKLSVQRDIRQRQSSYISQTQTKPD